MLTDRQFRAVVSGEWRGPLPATLCGTLRLLEHPYAWIVARKNARFDRGFAKATRVAAAVISVGNLTVGGTGKSPFVAWLARWFGDRRMEATVISRGYGASSGRPNDEALELAARLPGVAHLQNRDRIAAAREALAANPHQILIFDDAFQHRRLARDLDIVLLDALEPFGYGHLLPRGLLREPVESLARAHVVALSRSDALDRQRRREIEAQVRRVAPRATWIELVHRPTRLVSATGESLDLEGRERRRIAAFCGIGNPAGFRHTLVQCGFEISSWRELPDHCSYGQKQIASVIQWLEPQDVEHAICTCKDLVKIPHDHLGGKRLWALKIELEIARGREALEEMLKRFLGQAAPPAPHYQSQSESSSDRGRL
jgi:tetraacyldisaccharide 4'-kinase